MLSGSALFLSELAFGLMSAQLLLKKSIFLAAISATVGISLLSVSIILMLIMLIMLIMLNVHTYSRLT